MMKTVYYSDELNDDFAGTNIKKKQLPDEYKFVKTNPVWRGFAFVLHHIIVTPIVFLFNKITYLMVIKNKKVMRGYRKDGFFLYGNHILLPGDAFTPSLVTFPRKPYIIVNPDAVYIPIVGSIVEMLGGMPIPDDINNMKKFCKAVDFRAEKNNIVAIYPEAHIWPYYDDIRPFKDVSFKYPAKNNKPVFCFTTVLKKRLLSNRPRTVVYVDGPFLPDEKLSVRENQKNLRDKVYFTMKARAAMGNCQYIRYIKTDNNHIDNIDTKEKLRNGSDSVVAEELS